MPINMGSVVQKGLTIKSGQTHVKRYLEPLTKLIQEGKIDMSSMITHPQAPISKMAQTSIKPSRRRRTVA